MRQENLDIVRQLPEACSLAACLNLTAQLTCIANAITNGDPAALQKCLTTSMSQVYSFLSPTLSWEEKLRFGSSSAHVSLVFHRLKMSLLDSVSVQPQIMATISLILCNLLAALSRMVVGDLVIVCHSLGFPLVRGAYI